MKYSFTFNGWLGKVADDVTYKHMHTLGCILANYFKKNHTPGQKIVIGYDTRYFAKEFAEFMAAIMAKHEIKTFISNKPAPSSVLVSTSLYKKSMGTIVLTGDEHRPHFLGVRAFDNKGLPLHVDSLQSYSTSTMKYDGNYDTLQFKQGMSKGLIEPFDAFISYKRVIENTLTFSNNGSCINRTSFSPLYGSGVFYFGEILDHHQFLGYNFHKTIVSDFNGMEPVPSLHTDELYHCMLQEGSELGFMVSPDCSTFEFLIGPHKLSKPETLYLLCERLAKDGKTGTVLISDEYRIKVKNFERFGMKVQSVSNKGFQSTLAQQQHLLALDHLGRVYFSEHGAADALLVGYYLVDLFNDRSLTLAKIDQKVKMLKEMF